MRDKISKAFWNKETILLLFLIMITLVPHAQDAAHPGSNDTTSAGLPVTTTIAAYQLQVRNDPAEQLVDLQRMIPPLVLDLRYADSINFMHRIMYPGGVARAYLRFPAARALAAVQSRLARQGLGLKVFDAYRPYGVTVKFWQLVHDERYVANPAKGSGHNRGIAVDLTIISLKTGEELVMGTGFDNFTDTARQDFAGLPGEVLANRRLLRSVMEDAGFSALETEWWHYYYKDAATSGLLDLPFEELIRL